MPGSVSKSSPHVAEADEDTFVADAHAILFGFDPAPLRATLRSRSRAWRVGGAARTFGASVVIAPFVALLPPHAIWPIGALVTGCVLARRRLSERFTLLGIEGSCPKCGSPIQVKSGRLRVPHSLPCEVCHHESSLELPDGLLEAEAAD